MKKVLCWLTDNSEKLSHWATVLAFPAAAVAGFLAYGQLKVATSQIEQANDQRRWQNYNEMNVRYAELYKSIPDQISSGCSHADFHQLPSEAKRWVRQYFDLYSEEFWLFQNKLIPSEMWTHRIHGGVRVNLSKYPILIVGYQYWKSSGAFTHPVEFAAEVESAIRDSKSPPYITKPNAECIDAQKPNHSVERDGPKLRFGFPPPAAPAAPHVKRWKDRKPGQESLA